MQRSAGLLWVVCSIVLGCSAGGEGVELADPERERGTDDAVSATVDRLVDELNAFWLRHSGDLGFSYSPIPRSRVGDGDDGLLCDGIEVSNGDPDLDGNAFVDEHCAEGLMLAYDARSVDEVPLRLEITLAHEWGHIVQAQAPEIDAGTRGLPVDGELQADCFAGAWAALALTTADVEVARATIRAGGDREDDSFEDADAHGTGTQRVAAYDLGIDGGPISCIAEIDRVLPN